MNFEIRDWKNPKCGKKVTPIKTTNTQYSKRKNIVDVSFVLR